MKRKQVGILVALLAVATAGGAFAIQSKFFDDDETETPITGDALTRASAAALAFTGSGRVTETEVGDEESLYEIEVTLDDGRQIDVQLDENFQVVGSEADDENEASDND
jgi:multidrug resistance efflux pump